MKKFIQTLGSPLPWGVAWFVLYWVARGVLERDDVETWVRVVVALLPIPPFAFFLATAIRAIEGADELQRRIHLEALAIAFPLTLLMIMVLALMQRAIGLKFEDWSYAHVCNYLFILYFLGYSFAKGRYE